MSKYDDIEYWQKRGENYIDEFKRHSKQTSLLFEFQENRIKEELDRLKFKSVLEAGCGFGRMTKIISERYNPSIYDAFDISNGQIDNAKQTCKNVNFTVSPIENIDLKPQFYDLVFTSEMLMHIPFKKIESVIEKLVSASKKYIVNIDWHIGKTKQNYYCFAHDYETIYKKLGCTVKRISISDTRVTRLINRTPHLDQSIFIARRFNI